MDLRDCIMIKIKNLIEARDKYQRLIKEYKAYELNYRVLGIQSQIEVLEQVLDGKEDVDDWLICFREDEVDVLEENEG